MDWNEAELWEAAKDADMLKLAYVALPGCSQITRAYVDFRRPDVMVAGGVATSTEYAIQYRHEDLPTLDEDTELLIDDEKYRVRAAPEVPERGTGFSRIALLTKVDC